jgi:hypothetical protein
MWSFVKEEAGRKDQVSSYMFVKLEGTLWFREAFLMA